MSKKSKKPTENGVKRHNLTFSSDARIRGEQMATEDKRSFSNFVEVLIDAEWMRRKREVAA